MPPGASLLAAGFEIIKQYGGEEQVRLKVVIEVPGSWFGGGAEGALTAGDQLVTAHCSLDHGRIAPRVLHLRAFEMRDTMLRVASCTETQGRSLASFSICIEMQLDCDSITI